LHVHCIYVRSGNLFKKTEPCPLVVGVRKDRERGGRSKYPRSPKQFVLPVGVKSPPVETMPPHVQSKRCLIATYPVIPPSAGFPTTTTAVMTCDLLETAVVTSF